ncbi:MAG: aminomethyltransferase family protein, partial [Pseudomonadota bacterium]
RSNAFDTVAEECRAVRERVGINEIHNFGKYLVSGPNAVSWLNRIMANRVPDVGRVTLTPMLSPRGRIIGDFTMARIGTETVQLTASYAAQNYHMRWFLSQLQDGVSIENVSNGLLGFQIAGPSARALLGRVLERDVSRAAIPFMSVHHAEIGAIPVRVQRLSYTGDLGYEIYCDAAHQVALYHALAEAGEDLGMAPFGMRAMMSLRLEKFFGSWLREFKPDYTPAETGLDRFIDWGKNDFIGRDAVLRERSEPPKRNLAALLVETGNADAVGWEPVFQKDAVVGFVTSGGYAHYAQKSVALALIPADEARAGAEFEIEILGDRCPAVLTETPLVDADGARMRG